ncbi:MAG: sigma factor-like helix-turn-helix DNA-binding protein [Candidatus Acidiferrales bacterium]
MLDKAIGELAARERDVLALYHFEELTMKQVRAILGIGESRVSQIHSAALLRLRARLLQMTEKTPRVAALGPHRAAVAGLRHSAQSSSVSPKHKSRAAQLIIQEQEW